MRNRISLLLISLMAFTAIGCGSSFNPDGFFPTPDPLPPGTDRVNVRVAHLVAGGPAVDVVINGETALTNVSFETFSQYLGIQPGNTRIQVQVAGTGTDIIDETVPLTEAGAYFTVAAVGTPDEPFAELLEDDVTSPGADVARVRLFHAAPNVDVPVRLTDDEGNALSALVSFGQVSTYTTVPADYESDALQLRDADGNIVANYVELRNDAGGDFDGLPDSANITIVAAGDGAEVGDSVRQPLIFAPEQVGFSTAVADPAPLPIPPAESAFLRVAHMVPGDFGQAGPDVDVFIADAEEPDFQMVRFEDVTDYAELDAGDYVISVRTHEMGGDEPTELWEGPITLEADMHYTATAIANPDFDPQLEGSQPIGVLLLTDDVEEVAGVVSLRFVHAAPEVAESPVTLALWREDGNYMPLFAPVAFGQVTDYLATPLADLVAFEADEIRVVTLDGQGEVDIVVATFATVRDSNPPTNVIAGLSAAIINNGGNLNGTAFAAGTGAYDDDQAPTEIDLAAVLARDSADEANNPILISDAEPLIL